MVLVSGAKIFREIITHDAVMTVFILAQKGKMAFKTPFVPRGLSLAEQSNSPNLDKNHR